MTMAGIKAAKLEMMKRLYENKSGHIGSCLSVFEILAAAIDTGHAPLLSKAHANYAYQVLTGGNNSDDHMPGWGSLGYGLSIAIGKAIEDKSRDQLVIVGDGEMQEGTIWEAALLAPRVATNIKLVIDCNGLQGLDKTITAWYKYERILIAAGWDAQVVDGHDFETLSHYMSMPHRKPLAILAQTTKGHGVPFMADNNLWHYKTMSDTEYQVAVEAINAA